MSNCKYTVEILKPIFEESLSYAEVLRRLGLKQTGGSQTNIKRLAEKYQINTDHFLGRARNQGDAHRGGPKKYRQIKYLFYATRWHATKMHSDQDGR